MGRGRPRTVTGLPITGGDGASLSQPLVFLRAWCVSSRVAVDTRGMGCYIRWRGTVPRVASVQGGLLKSHSETRDARAGAWSCVAYRALWRLVVG